jgi:hypothetical protein
MCSTACSGKATPALSASFFDHAPAHNAIVSACITDPSDSLTPEIRSLNLTNSLTSVFSLISTPDAFAPRA